MLQVNKTNCYGCTACYSVCPKSAIKMKEDERGFLYPEVIREECVNCGLCEKLCCTQKYKKNEMPEAYAVKNKNDEIRMKSSSGGFFSLIANKILEENGIVYGATYDKKFNVRHKRITKKQELDELRGSKYIQSDLKDSFKNVKEDLKADRKVLFVGTPCQIYGLKKYLNNKEQEKLITLDLICHGVPSPKLWREFVQYIEKDNKSILKKFTFRNKKNGWRPSTLATFTNNVESNDKKIRSFFIMFNSDLPL